MERDGASLLQSSKDENGNEPMKRQQRNPIPFELGRERNWYAKIWKMMDILLDSISGPDARRNY